MDDLKIEILGFIFQIFVIFSGYLILLGHFYHIIFLTGHKFLDFFGGKFNKLRTNFTKSEAFYILYFHSKLFFQQQNCGVSDSNFFFRGFLTKTLFYYNPRLKGIFVT